MKRLSRREDGAVALIVAILSFVLLAVLAFVADFGMAYTHQRYLQNGVDAAALAAGRKIAFEAPHNKSCAQLAALYTTDAPTRSIAENYFSKNDTTPSVALPAGATGFQVTCETIPGFGAQRVVVKVGVTESTSSILGSILGNNGLTLKKTARVVVGPARSAYGLRPFAICDKDALALEALPAGTPKTISFDNADAGCGYAPGNWGTLDFNGGSNPTGELSDWITNGYDGSVSLSPPVIAGDPGAPSPGGLEDAMNAMMHDDDVVLPVFTAVTMQGQNGEYTISGFVAVKVCGWKLNNKSGHDGCTAPSPEPQNYLQLKFGSAIPLGELSTTCVIGDPTPDSVCDGPRVYKLAD